MKKNTKRFLKTAHKGIRKDEQSGMFEARKQIDGKPFRDVFSNLRDAINWKKTFHPHLTYTNTELVRGIDKIQNNIAPSNTIITKPNGLDLGYKFRDAWDLYETFHFPLLQKSSIKEREKYRDGFLSDLMSFKMIEINAKLLDIFMKKQKEKALVAKVKRRKNFDNDLKLLKAFLNFYRENYDEQFSNPILKRHYALGIIKKSESKKEKMTLKEFELFLSGFTCQFWRDVAEAQFFFSGRVQDVGGLQVESIFLEAKKVEVKYVAIWGDNKKFWYLKDIPKNGYERWVYINNRLSEILKRRIEDRPKELCEHFSEQTGKRLDFVFHIDGEPISYRQVQYQYNKALKRVGLDDKFSSTHFLRKAMAKATRDNVSLDAAQAIGGWRDIKVVQDIYTDIPEDLSIEASKVIENLIYGNKTNSPDDDPSRKLSLVN